MTDTKDESGPTPARKRPSGLGRGLNALFGDGAADIPTWPSPEPTAGAAPIDWAAYHRAFPEGFHGEAHLWRIHNNCYCLDTGGLRILVDCGVGVGPYPRYGNLRGELPVAILHRMSDRPARLACLSRLTEQCWDTAAMAETSWHQRVRLNG